MRTLGLLAPVLALAAPLTTQAPGAHWTQLATNTPAQTRENPGVSDGARFYVFGGLVGVTSTVRSNAFHSYDPIANLWTTHNADGDPLAPPARAQCGICWDFARSRLVVFGGSNSIGARLGDTWEWDGIAWSNVTPVSGSPAPRSFCALAYDWVNGKVLMFGGNDGTATPHRNDTWHWDGTSWTQLAPATVPATRQQMLLVSRPDQLDIVMAVGQNTVRHADTWRWDGTNWIQVTSATTPPVGRVALDADYDMVRRRVVITGGNNANLNPTGQISEFDGVNWVNRSPIPNPRPHDTRYFFAFVPATGKSYTFGGQTPGTGTWEYQSDSIATAAAYGSGCTGPGGPLALGTSSLPWTRHQTQNPGPVDFTITASGFGPASLGLAMVSLGQVPPGAFPLSNLTGILPGPGAGCDLLIASLDITTGLLPVAGMADYTLGLGDLALDPTLQDLPFYLQIAELDFSAGWIGTYTTNGLACTIGVL
jgi:hypothetical protein